MQISTKNSKTLAAIALVVIIVIILLVFGGVYNYLYKSLYIPFEKSFAKARAADTNHGVRNHYAKSSFSIVTISNELLLLEATEYTSLDCSSISYLPALKEGLAKIKQDYDIIDVLTPLNAMIFSGSATKALVVKVKPKTKPPK
ncbi:MAG: hypothetical protein WCW02_01105 [Candidatus Buchananbacteria bacterium]